MLYRPICRHHTVHERQKILTKLTQITFISATNCEELRVSQSRGRKGGRGHLCDITVSLTHPSGREGEVRALTLDSIKFTLHNRKRRTLQDEI